MALAFQMDAFTPGIIQKQAKVTFATGSDTGKK